MSEFVNIGKTLDIPPGDSLLFDYDGRQIAIYNLNGNFFAIDNFCPHKGGPLNEGQLIGNMVLCPWHRWAFDITNGKCVTNPIAKVSCFEIKVEGDDLLLKL